MSLLRTVFLGTILCGWMAYGGWFAAEILRQGVVQPDPVAAANDPANNAPRFLGSQTLGSAFSTEKDLAIAAFCLVGGAIGAGLGLAAGLSNSQLGLQVWRMLRGFVAGSLGGVSGGWLGAMIFQAFSPAGGGPPGWLRPVGWMVAGALVGLADGLFTLSRNRMRNGLIGGLVGGLIGGILFDPIRAMVAQAAGDPTLPVEITSRAAGFVAVGLCIGAAVGLTHLLLKHAWLTVLDGDRPGRQVILTGSGLTLGSDPSAGLSFLRDSDRNLFPTHLRIQRGGDGSFALLPASPGADAEVAVVKDGNREMYSLASQNANGIILENDCVIMCGRNAIRFNEKAHRSEVSAPSAATMTGRRPVPAPILPPKPPPSKPAPPYQPQRPAGPGPSPAHGAQAQPGPPSSPYKKSGPSATPAPQQPGSRPDPAAPKAENVCPNGHKVPGGQRYCILCDMEF